MTRLRTYTQLLLVPFLIFHFTGAKLFLMTQSVTDQADIWTHSDAVAFPLTVASGFCSNFWSGSEGESDGSMWRRRPAWHRRRLLWCNCCTSSASFAPRIFLHRLPSRPRSLGDTLWSRCAACLPLIKYPFSDVMLYSLHGEMQGGEAGGSLLHNGPITTRTLSFVGSA